MPYAKLKIIEALYGVTTPDDIRDIILDLGFNGFFFQRWYPTVMDNWEGHLVDGFLEHYYATQIFKWCPVARAIHQWHRNYTFAEARLAILVNDPRSARALNLWEQVGVKDGIVLFTGTNQFRSATILTCKDNANDLLAEHEDILLISARLINDMLPIGSSLLSKISRGDPHLSETQLKILEAQIDYPELTAAEMANFVGISPLTLQEHHRRIAAKTGVSTFAGALIQLTLAGRYSR